MLTNLYVRNLALIDEAEVPFGQGRLARIGGSGGIEILSTDEAAPATDKWPEPVAQRFYWNRKPHELESADGRFFIFKQRKNADPSRLMPHEFFDPAALPEYLTIDFWHPGDRMRTFGGQTKKLQDLFQEKRIPREYRRYFPVIKAGDEIIWVPGVCRSPFGKVTPTGKSIRLACFYRGAPDILSP